MFYSCGNGLGIYMTTEEYFSMSDEEFEYIISTHCYEYVDPFYNKKSRIRFEDIEDEEDIPKRNTNLDEILNIIDMKDNTDIFLGFDSLYDIDIVDDNNEEE